jgi:hypothetical protein
MFELVEITSVREVLFGNADVSVIKLSGSVKGLLKWFQILSYTKTDTKSVCIFLGALHYYFYSYSW